MDDLVPGGVVERVGELAGDAQCLGGRRRAVFANDDVERVGGGEVLREICAVAVDACRARRREHRMPQLRRDQLFELADQLVHALGRKIKPEKFDGDEPIAVRFVRAKHGTQSTSTDLMEDTKRTEGIGRRGAGSFRVQSKLL